MLNSSLTGIPVIRTVRRGRNVPLRIAGAIRETTPGSLYYLHYMALLLEHYFSFTSIKKINMMAEVRRHHTSVFVTYFQC